MWWSADSRPANQFTDAPRQPTIMDIKEDLVNGDDKDIGSDSVKEGSEIKSVGD